MTKQQNDLAKKTTGLGLSGKDFSEVPDWVLYDYLSPEAYAEFLETNKSYEVDSDEQEEG